MAKYSSMALPGVEKNIKKQLSEENYHALWDDIDNFFIANAESGVEHAETFHSMECENPFEYAKVKWSKGGEVLMVSQIEKLSKEEYDRQISWARVEMPILPLNVKIKFN